MEQAIQVLTIPEVRRLIDRICAVSGLYDLKALHRQIAVCETLTQENPPIDVVVFLLLIKADLLTPAQQRKVLQFIQQTLQRELGRELTIFLFFESSRAQGQNHTISKELQGYCDTASLASQPNKSIL